ncbi:hypothetical protein [Streptomyces albireticuli]|uniref:Uncharacterized protein n=1 Tax=Streptomyces albireticuli TaxID=1940 RepID=A0A2A2D140_9ACTN|nr:hypothetical protein [Streptomyces albireticuli]MCD9196067.1 hypothetical protein [Streptomyces albireticuli]PAU46178.1 hypothetical protein CK936_25625 [Streptomyces albireticuli]
MEWARPFSLHLTDGRIWHGVQFPTGEVCIAHVGEPSGAFTVGLSLDAVLGDRVPDDPLNGARVQWADEES